MAASEARAAWQRMANRCFVQEDAKRAPKLACCPSSSSKQQHDSSNEDAANGPDHPDTNFIPLDWNPVNSNLPPDTKWWLQLQPNFGYQKDFTCEQLNALEEELKDKTVENVAPPSKLTGDPVLPIGTTDVDNDKSAEPYSEAPRMVSTTYMNHDSEARLEELKAVNSNLQPIKRKPDLGEHWYQDEDLMDWKAVDRLISKKPEKACFDLETPWVGSEKTEPWWRTADKDELASLVAQKSLEHIENCDLPRPQKVHFCGDPFACLESFDDNKIFASSLDQKLHAGTCYPFEYAEHSSTSGSMDGKHWSSGDVGHSIYGSEKLFSATHTASTVIKDQPVSKHASESVSSKAELLEALRHSQTRAREAEMAAQQAYSEKEHIVKLFFKQASHLFAYKQWLRMLQLESLCLLHLKMKEHQISTLLPALPRMPLKGNQFGNGSHKARKRKERKHQKCSFCRYAVAFAVGLGLAGAGLLLGWTLGWLLPASF